MNEINKTLEVTTTILLHLLKLEILLLLSKQKSSLDFYRVRSMYHTAMNDNNNELSVYLFLFVETTTSPAT